MSRCTAGSDIAVTAARAEQLSPRAQLSQRGCPSLAVPQVASPRAPSMWPHQRRARAISAEQGPALGCPGVPTSMAPHG